MRHANRPDLLENVMAETITMRGRMIHSKKANGDFYEAPQDYDISGRVCLSPLQPLKITADDLRRFLPLIERA